MWEKKLPHPSLDVPFSMIGLPLSCGGRIIGMLHVILNGVGRTFSQEEQILLERFAGLASMAYDNAYLYHQAQKEIAERGLIEEKLRYMSFHDTLTGLYNRTCFEAELENSADGRYQSMGIIVCDVDGLKTVNDTLGHAYGDLLINAAGDVLKMSFRKEDVIARIGGDEFAVLLPEANEAVMKAAEQRIKENIADYPQFHGITLRMSVGWAVGNVVLHDLRQLLKKADKNMYVDKFSHKLGVS